MSHLNKKKIIVFLILVVTVIVSICKIGPIMNEYIKAAKLHKATIDEFVNKKGEIEDASMQAVNRGGLENVSESAEDDPNGWYHQIEVDIEGLQSVNQDVVGWIYFENEESISYPVLYSGDNEKYLRNIYTGEYVISGSIFIEGINKPDLSDAHTLIYGHNMNDLSMFGKLRYYKTEPDYYSNHRYFQIITKDKIYRYQIFAYEDNSQLSGGVYCVYDKPLDDFYEFLDDTICGHSQVSCDIDVRDYDHVVTLSTCSTAGSDYRFSVSAVRVDEHSRIPDYIE